MSKRIAAGLGALVVAASATVLLPGTANADWRNCGEAGKFCVWYYGNYKNIDRGDEPDYQTYGYTTPDNQWPEPIRNDDMSWFNNAEWGSGGGYDHVKIVDMNGTDSVTLCIEPGGAASWDDGYADLNNRGNYHYWSGDCSGIPSSRIIRD